MQKKLQNKCDADWHDGKVAECNAVLASHMRAIISRTGRRHIGSSTLEALKEALEIMTSKTGPVLLSSVEVRPPRGGEVIVRNSLLRRVQSECTASAERIGAAPFREGDQTHLSLDHSFPE